MRFADLRDFIENRMRMSHIYQPVMLMTLLNSGGRATVKQIATQFAQRDEALIEYYSKITKEMPGRVLGRNHGIVNTVRGENNSIVGYELNGFSSLKPRQIQILKEACRAKYEHYLEKRGSQIYKHRRMSTGYLSGTLKYEVLKRARFRCELCGTSAAEVALEVDHIVPRSNGGSDESWNLQALCFRCNARKRDRDDTDFRGNRRLYEIRESGCPFCVSDITTRIVREAELAYVIEDRFPVTRGHLLVIPKRHEPSWFDLTQGELSQCNLLIKQMKTEILESEPAVKAFNIGINCGPIAGQTIMHSHIHLIPRRAGDVQNARGGVRGVIPEKQSY